MSARDDILALLLDALPPLGSPAPPAAPTANTLLALDLAARLADLEPAVAARLAAIADEVASRIVAPSAFSTEPSPTLAPDPVLTALLDWLASRSLLSPQARELASASATAGVSLSAASTPPSADVPRDSPLVRLLALGLLPRDRLAAELGLPPPPRRLTTLTQMDTSRTLAVTGTSARAGAGGNTRSGAEAAVPAPLRPLDPDRYEIQAELGRGGMGVVYKAWDRELNRAVALKSLLLERSRGAEGLQRFHKEALASARLRHPHIVQLHDVGTWKDTPCLVMEFVPGTTLGEWIAATPLAAPGRLERGARVALQVAEAVAYAHRQGVVHRDIKPDNVLVDADGNAFLTDYGLAREVDGQSHLTQTGAVLGTPVYMSPEQADGSPASALPPTDIYALGALLYTVLTGKPPFDGATAAAIVYQVIHSEPPPPRRLRPGLPADLETICLRAMEKEPARRYAGAEELADDLRRFLAGEPIRAVRPGLASRLLRRVRRHPASYAAATVALAVLALALAWAVYAGERAADERRLREDAEAAERDRRTRREEADRLAGRARSARGEAAVALLGQALALDPANVQALLGRARELRDLGRFPEAVADCDRAILASPRPTEALLLRGSLLAERLGRVEDAVRDFQRLAELEPAGDAGPLALALVRAGQGRREEALALFEQALSRNPRNPDALLARARLLLGDGDAARARKDADQVITLRPEGAEGYLLRAEIRRAAGDRGGAIEDANRVLERNPENANGLRLRAALHAEGREVEPALADLNRLLALLPNETGLRVQRARLHLDRNDHHAALEDLAEVVRREPARREHRALRAETLVRAGRFPEALAAWTELLADGHGVGEEYLWRGVTRLLLRDGTGFLLDLTEMGRRRIHTEEIFLAAAEATTRLGRLDVSETLLTSVTHFVPKNDRAFLALGRVLALRGRWPAAAKQFTKAAVLRQERAGAASDPKSAAGIAAGRAEALGLLAEAQARAGDVDAAAQAATQALEFEAEDRRARTARALAWVRTGRATHALADLDPVLRAAPDDAWLHAVRAEAYAALLDFRAAAREADVAVAADPALPPAYVCRAELRARAADSTGALADLEAAVALEPALADGLAARIATLRSGAPGEEAAGIEEVERKAAASPPAEALAAWSAWLVVHPDDGRARLLRGRLQAAEGRPLLAQDDFLQAIDRAPPNPQARLALAGLRRSALADPAGALRDYDQLVRLGARSAELFLGRARAWTDLSVPSRAIAELGSALLADGSAAAAYAARGALYLDEGLLAPAAADLDRAIALYDRAGGTSAVAIAQPPPWDPGRCTLHRARARQLLGQTAAARADLDRYLAARPEDVSALVLRADCALALGDRQDAARDARRAVELAPDESARAAASMVLARALAAEGAVSEALGSLLAAAGRGTDLAAFLSQTEDAALDLPDLTPWFRVLDAALEAHPRSVPLRAARLRANLAAGRLREAGEEAAVLAQGGNEAAPYARLRLLFEKGASREALAEACAQEAAKAHEGEAAIWDDLAVAASGRSAAALLARGLRRKALRRFPEALRDFERAAARDPAARQARLERVSTLAFELRDHDRTVAAVDEALPPLAKDGEALAILGRALSWVGEVDRSIEVHGRGIEASPTYFDNYGERGLHRRRRGEWARAVPDLERAADLRKQGSEHLLVALAECRLSLGQDKEAEAALNRAVDTAPGNVEILRQRAAFLIQRGRNSEGESDCRRILERTGGKDPGAHFWVGHAALNQGKNREAAESFRRAVRRDDSFVEAHHFLALSLARAGEAAEAYESVSRVVRDRPGWAEGWLLRGQIALLLERKGDAMGDLRKARELKPELGERVDKLLERAEGTEPRKR
ncbi:MAG: protein kinase [Planctomycetes bacterium]|nr:protein kinase [Planctomycetota bacterium]